jgi:hypothetical protein
VIWAIVKRENPGKLFCLPVVFFKAVALAFDWI